MQGRVLKTTGSWYTVMLDHGPVVRCSIRGKLRLQSSRTTNPVTVGDAVDVEMDQEADLGCIARVHPRKNYIIRRATNLSRQSHVIAANIDQTLLIVTIDSPHTQLEFIDRYLATAQAYQIHPIIVFNKIDLYSQQPELMERLKEYISIYEPLYPCIQVSGQTDYNLQTLKELIKGRVSLLSGNSGVGKSTLINRLEPGLNLKTANISHYHQKGTHTTTFSEMFPLSFGGYVIDTPGLKGFGLVDMDKRELFHFFPELFATASSCQFYNCTHQMEPGCAVREAVGSGQISPSRYASYISMLNDTDSKYR